MTMKTNGHGRDDGHARHARVTLCSKTPWCTLDDGHHGCCVEVDRQPHKPADYRRGKR